MTFNFFVYPKLNRIIAKVNFIFIEIPDIGDLRISQRVSQKTNQPPRHALAGMPPLLEKEGKWLVINSLAFSSF